MDRGGCDFVGLGWVYGWIGHTVLWLVHINKDLGYIE